MKKSNPAPEGARISIVAGILVVAIVIIGITCHFGWPLLDQKQKLTTSSMNTS